MIIYLAIEIYWECGDYADPPSIEKVTICNTLDEAHNITHHVIRIEVPDIKIDQIEYKW